MVSFLFFRSPLLPLHKRVSTYLTTPLTFLITAIAAAVIFILIRCAFRVAELLEGFSGELANNEVLFMIFEGPMLILAVTCLTVFHPGVCFDGRWAEAHPSSKKQTKRLDTTSKGSYSSLMMQQQPSP
jgi:hypothetical protein